MGGYINFQYEIDKFSHVITSLIAVTEYNGVYTYRVPIGYGL